MDEYREVARSAWQVFANRFDYSPVLPKGATDAELRSVEEAVGVPLPPLTRAIFQRRNGLGTTIRDQPGIYVPLMTLDDVLDSYCRLCSVLRGLPSWNSLWLPISSRGNGDHHCLDLRQGASHGHIPVHDDDERPMVAKDLAEYMATCDLDDFDLPRYEL